MPAATPQSGPAALAVIATARLMVALDVTVVTGFLKTEGLT